MPERIGAYRLESPLGRGGMGEVFLAWDERLERPVAIKRIRQDMFQQGYQRERFRREARMAARLSHAAIVQIHDLVTAESGDAIVMEYVEGLTLAERLSRGPLDPAEAVRLAREIAEGLAAAHQAGLIHRDLKAENIVITPAGHAKILDFGLARPVSWDGEMLTLHGALIGTCYAMSPEQARGEELDERSDLFSFGALLYEMLTGSSPFRGKDPLATLQRVLHEQPPLLSEVQPDLPLRLSSLVERLLAKDRADRPRDALQVVDKLALIERELLVTEWPEPTDDSVSDLPTHAFPALPVARSSGSARRSSPATEGPRPIQRARSWILFLGGALSALLVAMILNYLSSNHKPPTVSEGDKARFATIHQRVRAGTHDLRGEIEKLKQIHESSPGFPDAWILAADLAGNLYESTQKNADLNLAREFIEKARTLAPDDPGTLTVDCRIALAARQPNQAENILLRLEKIKTRNDPGVLLLRARLEESRGNLPRAEEALRKAVERSRTWPYQTELVWFEMNHNMIPEARRDLNEMIEQYPGNSWVREQLAFLELSYGDLARAEQLYGDLASSSPPQRTYFTNLGLARSFRRRYTEAAEAYAQANKIEVGHPNLSLDLADAELDLGRETAAEGLYSSVLRLLEETRQRADLSPQEEMIMAQCLARLGFADKAREAVRHALDKAPGDTQRLYEAALVYSVLGDRDEALFWTKESLRRGMRARWFQVSAFASLRREPEFQALLKSDRPEQGL